MNESNRLAQLGAAVRLAGGVRAAAAKAQLDPTNTSRYLRGAGCLGPDAIRLLESALGRPDGQADQNSVIVLRSASVGHELSRGLSWYLPQGGEVARAAWSGFRSNDFRKLIRGVIGKFTPEVFAIRDSFGARLVLVLAAGLILPKEYFRTSDGPKLRWFNGERQQAVLDFGDDPEYWLAGDVTPDQFDSSWPGTEPATTAGDVIALIRRTNITFEEAMRRIADCDRSPAIEAADTPAADCEQVNS